MNRIKSLLIGIFTLLSLVGILISCGGGGRGAGDVENDCVSDSVTSSHWAKSYDTCSNTESGSYIQQTNDNGYILAGTVGFHFPPYEESFLITKLNSYGNVNWSKVIDRAGYGERLLSVEQADDGGYIIAGGSGNYVYPFSNDYALIKLDASGNIIWQRLYSDGGSINPTDDGGYVISGNSCLFKIDSIGSILWQKTYREIGGLIKQTTDGGYIVVRDSRIGSAFLSGNDIEVLKLDSDGNVSWEKRYSGEVMNWWVNSIHEITDGGYVFGGGASMTEGSGPFLVKLDSIGDISWAKATTAGGNNLNSMQPTGDGGYIVAGDTIAFNEDFNQDIWVVKFNQNGEIMWQKTYGGTHPEHGGSVIETKEGEYVLSGDSVSFRNNYDLWVLKLRSDGIVSSTAPSYIGSDTYAEVRDIPVTITVYEWNTTHADCSVMVSDAFFTSIDVNLTVQTQASD